MNKFRSCIGWIFVVNIIATYSMTQMKMFSCKVMKITWMDWRFGAGEIQFQLLYYEKKSWRKARKCEMINDYIPSQRCRPNRDTPLIDLQGQCASWTKCRTQSWIRNADVEAIRYIAQTQTNIGGAYIDIAMFRCVKMFHDHVWYCSCQKNIKFIYYYDFVALHS